MTHFKPHDDDDHAIGAQYGREVLFEVIIMGNSAKVTAIDAETGVEVCLVASARATTYSLKMNAMRKLAAALGKTLDGDADTGSRRPPRPGRYA